jgi:hypothetical protein
LTEENIVKQIEECKENQSWAKFIRLIGATFNNPESLSISFLQQAKTKDQLKHSDDDDESKKFDEDKDVDFLKLYYQQVNIIHYTTDKL